MIKHFIVTVLVRMLLLVMAATTLLALVALVSCAAPKPVVTSPPVGDELARAVQDCAPMCGKDELPFLIRRIYDIANTAVTLDCYCGKAGKPPPMPPGHIQPQMPGAEPDTGKKPASL